MYKNVTRQSPIHSPTQQKTPTNLLSVGSPRQLTSFNHLALFSILGWSRSNISRINVYWTKWIKFKFLGALQLFYSCSFSSVWEKFFFFFFWASVHSLTVLTNAIQLQQRLAKTNIQASEHRFKCISMMSHLLDSYFVQSTLIVRVS